MRQSTDKKQVFLFLQGPHGPFFHRLGQMLRQAGATVWRVGFNAGDRAFWFRAPGYIPFDGCLEDWPQEFARLITEKGVTDIVLYGDTREIHASAIAQAKDAGLTVHVFEEGYLRPFWVTYERGGSNGNSRLMQMTVAQMREALASSDMDTPVPPANWGDMRQHIFYGALYHWFVMFRNGDYPQFRTPPGPVCQQGILALFQTLAFNAHSLDQATSVRTAHSQWWLSLSPGVASARA